MKALDLCNGGMIWSCCVPRDRLGTQVRGQAHPRITFYLDFICRLTLSPHMPYIMQVSVFSSCAIKLLFIAFLHAQLCLLSFNCFCNKAGGQC